MLACGGAGLLCGFDGHVHHHVVVPQRHIDVGSHCTGRLRHAVRGDHHHSLRTQAGHFGGEVRSGRAGAEQDTLAQGHMLKSQTQSQFSRFTIAASGAV